MAAAPAVTVPFTVPQYAGETSFFSSGQPYLLPQVCIAWAAAAPTSRLLMHAVPGRAQAGLRSSAFRPYLRALLYSWSTSTSNSSEPPNPLVCTLSKVHLQGASLPCHPCSAADMHSV